MTSQTNNFGFVAPENLPGPFVVPGVQPLVSPGANISSETPQSNFGKLGIIRFQFQ